MRKFKIFGNFTEEENYLNEMSKNGYIFKKNTIFGFYHFKKETPTNLNYKIDYRSFKTKPDFNNYIVLFEDSGWKHISGDKNSGRQYFLPMNTNSSDDIFSDKDSSDDRYKTFFKISQSMSALFTFLIVFILSQGIENLWFQTPGLWNLEGALFIKAFLFEFPFVLLRVLPVFIVLFLMIVYSIAGSKAKKMYESLNKN